MKHILEQWNLSDPKVIANTETSDVYKVKQANGQLAVLKHLNEVGQVDEAEGATLLKYFDGEGAIQVLNNNEEAVLLEYADGGELAELVYAGQDDEATSIICDLVKKLHADRNIEYPQSLVPLGQQLSELLEVDDSYNDDLVLEARDIGRELIRTTTNPIPLHGDLHHHNILGSDRGWLAIDPKGLIGDPCYDVANFYGNPEKAQDLSVKIERANRLTQKFSDELGYPYERIARFAFVHNMISTLWGGCEGVDKAHRRQVAQNIRLQF